MRSWSIPAGRLFGVELRVHLTFLFLLFFVWMTEAGAAGHPGALRGVVLVLIVFGSVVLHELGHAVVALRSGLTVKSILLLPIGGITFIEEPFGTAKRNPARDIRIALAGPLVNIVLAIGGIVLLSALAPQIDLLSRPFLYSANLPRSFVWANIFLATFNLLPAYPMDGGRVLRAMFARHMDYLSATRRAVTVGQAFAMVFMFAGFFWNIWLAVTGFFLFVAAQLEERSMLFQSVMETVRLEEVMLTDFATLSPADTLEDALAKAVHSLQDDFPVVRGNDMVGVVSRQHMLEALRSGNGYVQSVMNRAYEVAQKNESLASALRKLSGRDLSLIPVVDQDRLVGIVTLQNLTHNMALLAETRRLQRSSQ